MNAILFVFDWPTEANEEQIRVRMSLVSTLQTNTPKPEEGEALAPNCWLLKLPHGAPILGHAIVESGRAGIPYRLLILQDEDLEWIVPTPRS